jgi:hypothetical protein
MPAQILETRWSAAVVFGWLVVPTLVFAQAAPESSLGSDRRDARSNLTVLPTLATPTSAGYSVSLDATTTDKKGTVSFVLGNAADTKTFTISAFGPIDADAGEAVPLSLDGLGQSAGAEFALNVFHWSGTPDAAGLRRFCQAKLKKDECDDDEFSGADRAAFLDLANADETPWLITVKGAVGRTKFTYSPTRTPFAPQSDYQNDWSLGASVGRYEPTMGYVAARYSFQRTWTPAGAARQFCSPIEAGSAECRSYIVGPPAVNEQQIVDLQWRKFLPGGRVALNPIVGRDFDAEITFVRVPVYFFTDANGGLAGGARFEWRSDTREPSFVVFVGAVLKILGEP